MIKEYKNIVRTEEEISFEVDGIEVKFAPKDEFNDYSNLSDEDLVLSRTLPEYIASLNGVELGNGNPSLSWNDEYRAKMNSVNNQDANGNLDTTTSQDENTSQ